MRFVERRGYLTLVLEGAGLGRTYFRRTEDLRSWGDVIRNCVIKKKEEFGQMKSTDDFWRYKEDDKGGSRDGDAWLLSRQVPGTLHRAGLAKAKVEDADSGLDSLQEESSPVQETGECVIQSDEMQEVRLNMRARNACLNSRSNKRARIPDILSKVTKV